MEKKHIRTIRTGGLFEGAGFILILIGMIMMIAGTWPGGMIIFSGLIVFIIGRCL